MNKSPDAFRTISEVAEQLDVPAHVLRFWETRFSQVKPVKRGGGRRYYRPDDVRLLRGIRGLLYDDGMTIKGVQKILREQGVRHVIGLGTVDETEVAAPAPAVAAIEAPPVLAEAEPVLATAGAGEEAPGRQRGVALASGNGPDRPQPDLFVGATAVERAPADGRGVGEVPAASPGVEVEAEADPETGAEGKVEEIVPPIGRKVDREALRRLVGELEALRRVMIEGGPA